MIRLGHNAVPKEAEREILKVFRSGQFSPGPKVREFEESFAKAHHAKHAVFVNSGTDALRLSLLAMKEKYHWQDGDRVAVTTQTFVATVNVILQAKLTPFFYDAGNPWNLEHRLRCSTIDRIKAVMPVHLFGEPANPYIYELAKKNGWKVLEDSCETILNKPRGEISCHSTYMAHHVTTGVGGLALTNDNRLNLLIRSYANHGRNTAYLPHYKSLGLSEDLLKRRFRFDREGYSCRGTEFEAVLGLAQVAGLKENVRKRRELAGKLYKALEPFQNKFHMKSPAIHPDHTFFVFPITAKENMPFDKYRFCLHLEKNGIETRDAMPITSQPCYKTLINETDYPASYELNQRGFYIPCHPGMNGKDIEQIRAAFEAYLTNRRKRVIYSAVSPDKSISRFALASKRRRDGDGFTSFKLSGRFEREPSICRQ